MNTSVAVFKSGRFISYKECHRQQKVVVVVVLVLAAVAVAVAVDKYKDEIVPVHAEVITKLNSELKAMQVLVSTGHIYTHSKLLQLPVFVCQTPVGASTKSASVFRILAVRSPQQLNCYCSA